MRLDLLIHLRLSESGVGTPSERETLFKLDEVIESQFEGQYDGNDIGEGEFLIHLVPKGDPDQLLAQVLQLIPAAALRPGSYAVIRAAGRDEDSERVIALAGEPAIQPEHKQRKPLSFGMVVGGETSDNRALLDYIKILWRQIRETPDASTDAASLIVIWHVGGDISSPTGLNERVKIEKRTERLLGSTIEIPRGVAASTEPARLVEESLARILDKSDGLIKRRKLGWDLSETRTVVSRLAFPTNTNS